MFMRAHRVVMAATAQVIWLCACVRYWPDRGLVFDCITFFYFVIKVQLHCERLIWVTMFKDVS